MSRVTPAVFVRPGLAPGQIIARGGEEATARLAAGVLDLERRQDEMRRTNASAKQNNENTVKLTEASIRASEGEINEMPGVIESQSSELQAQINEQEDPKLRAQMTRDLERQTAQLMSRTLQIQNSRMVGETRATGEQVLKTGMDAMEAGTKTIGEVIGDIVDFVGAQKENVYGENADKVIGSMVSQAIDQQFSVLLKTSPKEAIKFADGATTKEWLTLKERDAMRSEAVRTINSSLINIESRAVAVSNSLFPDKVEQLVELRGEAEAFPEVGRTKLTLKEIDARITLAKKQQTRTVDRVALGFAVLTGRSDEPMPNEQATLNTMYQQVKSDRGQLQVFLQGLMREGVDFPDSYVRDLERDGKQGTLNLSRGLGQLRQIAGESIDRAARLAASSGLVMETAYGVTLRIDDPIARQEWEDILSSPDAPALIAAADKVLGDDLLDQIEAAPLSGVRTFGFLTGATIPLAIGLIVGPRKAPRMGPEEATELKDSYRAHYVKARRDLATDDSEILKAAALKNAANDWDKSHSAVKITVGRNHFRYIPNSAVLFDKSLPLDQATSRITREANNLLKSAGSGAGFLSANPIVSQASRRSWFAVTNADGVHGFVEWDANEGKARSIREGDEFDKLRTQMSVRRLNPTPNAELVRRPGQTTMSDQQQADFVDMGIAEFQRQNGRLPGPGDEPAVNALTSMFEEGKGWID